MAMFPGDVEYGMRCSATVFARISRIFEAGRDLYLVKRRRGEWVKSAKKVESRPLLCAAPRH